MGFGCIWTLIRTSSLATLAGQELPIGSFQLAASIIEASRLHRQPSCTTNGLHHNNRTQQHFQT